jgi:hypothetical protein
VRRFKSGDGIDTGLLDETVDSGEDDEVQEVQQVHGMVTGKVSETNLP